MRKSASNMSSAADNESNATPRRRRTKIVVKRRNRCPPPQNSDHHEGSCWLAPTEPPRIGFDGSFIRPKSGPEGFDWDPKRGVWVSGGKEEANDADEWHSLDKKGAQLQDDGEGIEWVKPETPPKQGSYGRFLVPKETPPVGFTVWDRYRGVWVRDPTGVKQKEDDTIASENYSEENYKASSRDLTRSTAELDAEGIRWILPKHSPKQGSLGRYLRPEEDPPEGYKWDRLRGVWVQREESALSFASAKERDSESDSYSRDTSSRKDRSSHTAAEHVDVTGYGRYLGSKWDRERGAWVPRAISRGHDEPSSSGDNLDEESHTSVSKSERAGAIRTSEKTCREKGDSEAWLAPQNPPKRGRDGRFIRPTTGPPVEGFTWDRDRGVWRPGRQLVGMVAGRGISSERSAYRRRKRRDKK